ncbi:BlaI/MecI/CopY family transcriptional regulator [Odoribacter lunatus]|uniref:BlaI/MecI/CopY family transcriptional regulator n=1 Tax=Odoribacter lunatus TaxID=2941335 RepID=UPI00203D7085|nr:BlaI/MecI/CopY family transcriptional regulator [Odoribacter lunatus]
MKELTKAEEQIMQVLWEIKKGFVKDIIEQLPAPKPAYNTVSTIVRILQDKKFVGHEAFGKSHCYFPVVDKETYTRKFLRHFIGSYFNNSFPQMVSFFAKEENIDLKELEEILQFIKNLPKK